MPRYGTSLAAAPAPASKRILILGGTGFLGPATGQAARARGHELTLFNRRRDRQARHHRGSHLAQGATRRRPDEAGGTCAGE
jgi:nucleoside-diphosphate-sugar epimerase